jgi:hypothetical protein
MGASGRMVAIRASQTDFGLRVRHACPTPRLSFRVGSRARPRDPTTAFDATMHARQATASATIRSPGACSSAPPPADSSSLASATGRLATGEYEGWRRSRRDTCIRVTPLLRGDAVAGRFSCSAAPGSWRMIPKPVSVYKTASPTRSCQCRAPPHASHPPRRAAAGGMANTNIRMTRSRPSFLDRDRLRDGRPRGGSAHAARSLCATEESQGSGGELFGLGIGIGIGRAL